MTPDCQIGDTTRLGGLGRVDLAKGIRETGTEMSAAKGDYCMQDLIPAQPLLCWLLRHSTRARF